LWKKVVRTGAPSKVAALPLPAGLVSGAYSDVAQVMPSLLKLSSKLTITNCGADAGAIAPGGDDDRARAKRCSASSSAVGKQDASDAAAATGIAM
jgi:hypothetical protein